MQVKDRSWLADRVLGHRIDPLDPRAKLTIAKREVIDQRPVSRPVRMAAMVSHYRYPRRWLDRPTKDGWSDVDLPDVRGVRRVERDPLAIWRKVSLLQVPFRM